MTANETKRRRLMRMVIEMLERCGIGEAMELDSPPSSNGFAIANPDYSGRDAYNYVIVRDFTFYQAEGPYRSTST